MEKPLGDQANYVFAGMFVLQRRFITLLERHRQSMSNAFEDLIEDSVLKACLWEEGWMDIIYPWHILEANRMLMEDWNQSRIDETVILK